MKQMDELDKTIWIVQILLSVIFLVAKLSLLVLIFIWWRKSTRLQYLFEGIKLSLLFFIIFHVHFLLFWLILGLILFLNYYLNISITMWILLVFQIVSFSTNILKIFSQKLLYFQILAFKEFSLILDTAVIVYVVMKNDKSYIIGLAIAYKNLAMGVFFFLSSIIVFISSKIINFYKKKNLRKVGLMKSDDMVR